MNITHWPTEIKLAKNKRSLAVTFAKNDSGGDSGDDAKIINLPAELLRVESPSAEVQGHGADQKTTPDGKQNVAITAIEAVGNYAIRIIFDDGHETGIFSWDLLYDYGVRQDQLMADYLARLEEAGLSR
ncbi:DUF971 domain-containing protein [Alphaproteobacteria bacterium]|nr:DUF971 domain-containing protein [Alphaproteobacteria bacterium]